MRRVNAAWRILSWNGSHENGFLNFRNRIVSRLTTSKMAFIKPNYRWTKAEMDQELASYDDGDAIPVSVPAWDSLCVSQG
jgi:hypothetical protein